MVNEVTSKNNIRHLPPAKKIKAKTGLDLPAPLRLSPENLSWIGKGATPKGTFSGGGKAYALRSRIEIYKEDSNVTPLNRFPVNLSVLPEQIDKTLSIVRKLAETGNFNVSLEVLVGFVPPVNNERREKQSFGSYITREKDTPLLAISIQGPGKEALWEIIQKTQEWQEISIEKDRRVIEAAKNGPNPTGIMAGLCSENDLQIETALLRLFSPNDEVSKENIPSLIALLEEIKGTYQKANTALAVLAEKAAKALTLIQEKIPQC